MALLELQKAVAGYGGHPAGSTARYTPADYVIDTVDYTALAINNARRVAERLWDFTWSQTNALLTIAAGGTSISTATADPSGTIVIKRVQGVMLPIAGSVFIPVEFLTDETYQDRLRNLVGRQVYSATATADDLGIAGDNPFAVQQGQVISLYPASQFSFPVAAKLNVVRFLPDYSGNTAHDFIMDVAPEYLLYQAIVELNRLTKNFSVRPSEGDVSEPMELAQLAFEGLVKWDISLNKGTSTPNTEIPQLPRPPQPQGG